MSKNDTITRVMSCCSVISHQTHSANIVKPALEELNCKRFFCVYLPTLHLCQTSGAFFSAWHFNSWERWQRLIGDEKRVGYVILQIRRVAPGKGSAAELCDWPIHLGQSQCSAEPHFRYNATYGEFTSRRCFQSSLLIYELPFVDVSVEPTDR